MRKLVTGLICAGAMLAGNLAFAENPSHPTTMTKEQQWMKDCEDKAAMKNDGMTKEQMTEWCKKEMKMHSDEMKKNDADKDDMKKKY